MAVRSLQLFVICMTMILSVSAGAAEGLSGLRHTWLASAFKKIYRVATLDGAEPAKDSAKAYYSQLIKEDSTITLKGNTPSDNDLKLLQGILAAAAPGANLVDRSRVVAGVPDRDAWLAGMTFALRHLSKLESGRVTLKDNCISMEGVTKPDDDFAALQLKISQEVPKGLTLKQAGIRPAAVKPFVWLAQVSPGVVSLSGHVPDEFGQFLVAYAQSLFKAGSVDNEMASAAGAPDGWIGAAKLSLEMLNLLRQGRVVLTDHLITLDGVLSSPSMAELLKVYKDKLPEGFTLQTNISNFGPRTPAAWEPPVSGDHSIYRLN